MVDHFSDRPRRRPLPPTGTSMDTTGSSQIFSSHNAPPNDLSLEPLAVSDGFAPGPTGPPHALSSPSIEPSRSRPPMPETFKTTEASSSRDLVSPLPEASRNSFALANDSRPEHSPVRRGSVGSVSTISTSAPRARAVSAVSDVSVVRAQSPYQGAAGPAHPYGMYPQGIGMPSRSSIGSTSTTRPPRQPYAGPSGPQHPYAMYPQNTVPEDAGPSSGAPAATAPATAPATTITLGFPGLGQAYQRRLGPEGEEAADIIGPDGHTEQLPPYTKYPAAVPPKDVAGAASASLSAVPPAVALRGGGLGSPTEPTAESLALRRSRHSTHSMMSDSSRAPLYVDPSAPYRAPSTKEKLVVKGKKRVCWGKVPLWVLLAALIFVLFCAVIIFGVSIPRMIAAREDKQEQDLLDDLDDGQPQPNFGSGVGLPKETRLATLTTTFGAAPLATAPPGTSPIPSGTFSLRLADAVYKSDLCLKDPKQRGAWSCAFPNKKTNMQLQVTEMQDSAPLIQIFAPAQPDGLPKYGAQPPTVGAPTVMGRATDLDDPARGPAFVFQTPYTKIVIVRNNSLGAEAGPDKRAILEAMELHEREEWEALEERDGLDVRDELLSRNWGGDGDGDRGGRGKLRPFRNIPNVKKGDQPWYCYWNNTVLEGFVYLNQDSSAVTQPANDTDDDPASLASNGTVQDAPPEAAPLGAVFPRVFKLEELRVGGSLKTSPPYCVQMQATSDGEVDALLGQDGKPVQVQLDESSTPLVRRRWGFSRRMAQKRQEGTGNCRCRWMAA